MFSEASLSFLAPEDLSETEHTRNMQSFRDQHAENHREYTVLKAGPSLEVP